MHPIRSVSSGFGREVHTGKIFLYCTFGTDQNGSVFFHTIASFCLKYHFSRQKKEWYCYHMMRYHIYPAYLLQQNRLITKRSPFIIHINLPKHTQLLKQGNTGQLPFQLHRQTMILLQTIMRRNPKHSLRIQPLRIHILHIQIILHPQKFHPPRPHIFKLLPFIIQQRHNKTHHTILIPTDIRMTHATNLLRRLQIIIMIIIIIIEQTVRIILHIGDVRFHPLNDIVVKMIGSHVTFVFAHCEYSK
mmetsp:Transcript_21124/g.27208  ORF Transcript_21124/g.27208 Transcript_21124/m.27208 type:complete len:246 (-) Transcript_21124:142-879(-)